MDTIFALSTPAGRSGVALIRISGERARAVLEDLTRMPLPAPRRAVLRKLWAYRVPSDDAPTQLSPDSGEGEGRGLPIDQALVVWFPAPNSFTGEDTLELNLHGGLAVISAMLHDLARRPGLRLAEAGEFSRRAFDNGKLDLTEIEGLADLIAAETEAQRRQALRQAEGETSRLYEGWRQRLIRNVARHEALIDFPDEDVPESLKESIAAETTEILAEIDCYLDDRHRGERLRDGLTISILGAPNVGKSSLLNRIARREAAIVSSQAGTTRDIIEVHMDLHGFPVTLADTAGLRATADEIEAEGVRRALARAENSDIKLLVFDGALWPNMDRETARLIDENALLVLNKVDLKPNQILRNLDGHRMLPVSARTGEGLDELLAEIESFAAARMSAGDAPVITRLRHREALERCRDALSRSQSADLAELQGEDLRIAVHALGRITGRVDVEDILDVIFAEFCIGK